METKELTDLIITSVQTASCIAAVAVPLYFSYRNGKRQGRHEQYQYLCDIERAEKLLNENGWATPEFDKREAKRVYDNLEVLKSKMTQPTLRSYLPWDRDVYQKIDVLMDRLYKRYNPLLDKSSQNSIRSSIGLFIKRIKEEVKGGKK